MDTHTLLERYRREIEGFCRRAWLHTPGYRRRGRKRSENNRLWDELAFEVHHAVESGEYLIRPDHARQDLSNLAVALAQGEGDAGKKPPRPPRPSEDDYCKEPKPPRPAGKPRRIREEDLDPSEVLDQSAGLGNPSDGCLDQQIVTVATQIWWEGQTEAGQPFEIDDVAQEMRVAIFEGRCRIDREDTPASLRQAAYEAACYVRNLDHWPKRMLASGDPGFLNLTESSTGYADSFMRAGGSYRHVAARANPEILRAMKSVVHGVVMDADNTSPGFLWSWGIGLNDSDRELLELYYDFGYSQTDLAARFDITQGAVSRRLEAIVSDVKRQFYTTMERFAQVVWSSDPLAETENWLFYRRGRIRKRKKLRAGRIIMSGIPVVIDGGNNSQALRR